MIQYRSDGEAVFGAYEFHVNPDFGRNAVIEAAAEPNAVAA